MASQSQADWDIDDADEIPGGQAAAKEESEADGIAEGFESAAAGEEWNLDDGWETNIPIDSPVAAASAVAEVASGNDIEAVSAMVDQANEIEPASEPATEDCNANPEVVSLVAADDPEAAIESTAEVAASEEVATESPAPAASPQPAGEAPEPVEETTDDILALIVEAERKCDRTGSIVTGLTARLKEAKENDKAAQNELRELIREVGNDSTRPMVARPAAAKTESPANAAAGLVDDDADEEDEGDEGDTDLEDSGDGESAREGEPAGEDESAATRRGNPTRIKIAKEDESFPQLLLGDEHAVTEFGAEGEGVVTITDPADPNNELFLAADEYEAVAWEELPTEESAKTLPISTGPNSASASQAKADKKNSRPEDDSWRKASLANDVGLPPNLAELLESNPEKTIKTMGDLSDWTEAGRRLDEIPKIGPAKVTKIDEATDKFWARWNERK